MQSVSMAVGVGSHRASNDAHPNFHIPREFGNLGELHIWKFRIKVPEFTITTAQNLKSGTRPRRSRRCPAGQDGADVVPVINRLRAEADAYEHPHAPTRRGKRSPQ